MLYSISLAVVLFHCSNVALGIIGGRPAPNYPFFAVVYRGDHMCGGALIRLDAVLTAAHCLYFDTESRWASPIEVYVLHGDVSTPNNWILRYHSCENFFVHFDYKTSIQGVRSPFDVAVIKLEDKVYIRRIPFQRSILPICRFSGEKDQRNMYGVAIGLGLTNLNPPVRAKRLMQASIQRIDCRLPEFEVYPISQTGHYCYSILGGSSITDTDFGGPMIVGRNNEAICIIGAASWSIYSPTLGYFASIVTAGGKFRYWLNRVFRENFTYDDVTTIE